MNMNDTAATPETRTFQPSRRGTFYQPRQPRTYQPRSQAPGNPRLKLEIEGQLVEMSEVEEVGQSHTPRLVVVISRTEGTGEYAREIYYPVAFLGQKVYDIPEGIPAGTQVKAVATIQGRKYEGTRGPGWIVSLNGCSLDVL